MEKADPANEEGIMALTPRPIINAGEFAGVAFPVPISGLTIPRKIVWPLAVLSSSNTLFVPMYMG